MYNITIYIQLTQKKESTMYGTIAKIKVKKGMEEAAIKDTQRDISGKGYIGHYLYKMDDNPDEFYIVVVFESKESYHANAQRPETNADYERMLEYVEGEPEWKDGEIVMKAGF